jgi:hypothetical protein
MVPTPLHRLLLLWLDDIRKSPIDNSRRLFVTFKGKSFDDKGACIADFVRTCFHQFFNPEGDLYYSKVNKMRKLQINLVYNEQVNSGLAASKQELALLDSLLGKGNEQKLGTRKVHYLQEGEPNVALFAKRFLTGMLRAFAVNKIKPTWWCRLNADVIKRLNIKDDFPPGGFNNN